MLKSVCMQIQRHVERWGAKNLLAPLLERVRQRRMSPLRRTASIRAPLTNQLEEILSHIQEAQEEIAAREAEITRFSTSPMRKQAGKLLLRICVLVSTFISEMGPAQFDCPFAVGKPTERADLQHWRQTFL